MGARSLKALKVSNYYITIHKEGEMVSKKPNEIEEYFISIAEKCFPIKKHVSHIYKRLTTDISQNTWNIKKMGAGIKYYNQR